MILDYIVIDCQHGHAKSSGWKHGHLKPAWDGSYFEPVLWAGQLILDQ